MDDILDKYHDDRLMANRNKQWWEDRLTAHCKRDLNKERAGVVLDIEWNSLSTSPDDWAERSRNMSGMVSRLTLGQSAFDSMTNYTGIGLQLTRRGSLPGAGSLPGTSVLPYVGPMADMAFNIIEDIANHKGFGLWIKIQCYECKCDDRENPYGDDAKTREWTPEKPIWRLLQKLPPHGLGLWGKLLIMDEYNERMVMKTFWEDLPYLAYAACQ